MICSSKKKKKKFPFTLWHKPSLYLTFCFQVQSYYLEQKWVFLALMNSGNFGLVWGSQPLCSPAWQNFIRGLMQLKYFSFTWTRKTQSHWVVKSGRVLYVHLWRMGAWVCLYACDLGQQILPISYYLPKDLSVKRWLFSWFSEPKHTLLKIEIKISSFKRSGIIENRQQLFLGAVMRNTEANHHENSAQRSNFHIQLHTTYL